MSWVADKAKDVVSNPVNVIFPGAIGADEAGEAGQDALDKISGKDAAEDAAAAQRAATDAAVGFQEAALKKTREDLQPFREAGANALNDLSSSIQGLPSSSNISTAAIDAFVNNGGREGLDANIQQLATPEGQAQFLKDDPLFAAISEDTNRRLNAQAAAAGKLHSGGTADALQKSLYMLGQDRINNQMNNYLTGFNAASTNRSNSLNDLMTQFNVGFNKANLDSNLAGQRTNSLFNLVTQGQNAAARQATATQNTGNNLANLTTAQGNAEAAAQVAPYNNLMQLAQTGANAAVKMFGIPGVA